MSRHRAIVALTIVVFVVLSGVWYVRARETPPVIDLVEKLLLADRKPAGAGPDVFSVRNEKIAGETKRAIYVYPPTRITWQMTLPQDAWLRTFVGVDAKAWDKDGDGVLFFIGVSHDGRYDTLFEQRLDPHASRADRRWVRVILDLSEYSGKKVNLIFNTRTSLKGDDPRNDFAYWGEPAVTLRP